MSREKIRVSLHAFNYKFLDEASKKILTVLSATENSQNIKGPIPLPTRKRIYCVLRSPHVDKDSREQFEIRQHKRIIDVFSSSDQLIDALVKIEMSPAISTKIVLLKN